MGILEESRIEVSLVPEPVLASLVRVQENDPQGQRVATVSGETVEIPLGAMPGAGWVFPPVWLRLPFAMQRQQQTQWCWAATSVSVALYYRPTSGWTQCQMVNLEKGQTTCCQNGSTPECNQPNVLDSPLRRAGVLDHMVWGTVTYDAAKEQILVQRPLPLRIQWAGGGGHFIAIQGVALYFGTYVAIGDSWYGPSDITWKTLFGTYQGSGTWTHTYFTKPQASLSLRPVRVPLAIWERVRKQVMAEAGGG